MGFEENIIGVIKAKTAIPRQEGERWRAEEVLHIRGVPSNPIPGAGTAIEANEARRAELVEDQYVRPSNVSSVTRVRQLQHLKQS